MLKCPFIKGTDCIKESCAVWHKQNSACSLWSIADSATVIMEAVDAIAKDGVAINERY